MTATRSARWVTWFACLALAALAAGCGKTMTVMLYPDFYTPELKTVGVWRFRNDSSNPEAGEIFTDTLAAALKANGTYRVLGPGQLKAALDKAKIELAPDADRQQVLKALASLGGVQAVLTGRVGQFASGRSVHRQVYVDYPYHGYHGPHYGWHGRHYYRTYGPPYQQVYYVTRHEASASASSSLWRVADGAQLHAMALPARAAVVSRGSPPPLTPGECLYEAGRHVAQQIVEEFALTPRRVKIKPGKALKTATGRTGAAWHFDDDFKADDEEMFVVVALPGTCHRNRFRLEIARKDVQEALAGVEFEWSREKRNVGFAFSPRDLVQQAGAGTFDVRFYAGDQFVMRRRFKIKK